MGYLLVELNDLEVSGTDPTPLLDAKLEGALQDTAPCVVVRLHPGCENGLAVIQWAKMWQQKMEHAKKTFIIIAQERHHFESFEYSNPDDNLIYVPALEDVEKYARFFWEKEPVQQPDVEVPIIPAVVVTPPEVAYAENPALQDLSGADFLPPADELLIGPLAPDLMLKIGERVGVSGEFVCMACGASRMWMRDEKSGLCENPECQRPSAGWKLTFDLF